MSGVCSLYIYMVSKPPVCDFRSVSATQLSAFPQLREETERIIITEIREQENKCREQVVHTHLHSAKENILGNLAKITTCITAHFSD